MIIVIGRWAPGRATGLGGRAGGARGRETLVGEAMPLRWDILHDEKFVHVIAEGPVTLKEMEEHFDALVVANALEYAKLFNASKGHPVFTDEEVMTLGARLSAYTATMKSGPLAVVGEGDTVQSNFRRFVNLSPSRRPARVFKNEAQARNWLKSMADQVTDQRSDKFFG